MPSFSRVLIANRGEIAVRIAKTARALGYRTVAVFSEADADALHVEAADEAVCIGPAPAPESYLSIDRVLEAATKTEADALHPGYGFLAENPGLARRCERAGIVFIGPPSAAIELMGDKAKAKQRMREAGVPCVPGSEGVGSDDATLAGEADAIGFPLLVKAAAGGGGRGMRLVRAEQDLAGALASARSESLSAFGSDEVLLERVIARARHVEIQVFCDSHQNAVYLGERDCSAQRRHQKIVEESPSPAVDADLRARMGEAAVKAAQAIGYVGAGTVEFLLDADGSFYFLEMNTRLQVEHPVTEMLTGLDLVAWQLHVAHGGALPLGQSEVALSGHAIEARVYAEDPAAGFLPQTGRVLVWYAAGGEGVRVDAGIATGREVSTHYDPMLAKVVAHGETRDDARRRLIRAIEDSTLLGLTTNRAFLCALLRDPTFIAGDMTTSYVEDGFEWASPEPTNAQWAMAGVLSGGDDPWYSRGRAWWPMTLEAGDQKRDLRIAHLGGRRWEVEVGDETVVVEVVERDEDSAVLEIGGVRQRIGMARDRDVLHLDSGGVAVAFSEPRIAAAQAPTGDADGRLLAPTPGRVVAIRVQPGDAVAAGQCVAVLEAMKMEHEVVAGADGIVDSVSVGEGDQVQARQVLVNVTVAAPSQ